MAKTMITTWRFSLILLLGGVLLASCAYGPKTEKKSVLNYLSGEHYEGKGPTVADVPVVKEMDAVTDVPLVETIPLLYKRKRVLTVIRGTAVIDEFRPLKYKPLQLLHNNTPILKTTTDHLGAFKFSGSLPSGDYTIKVDAAGYGGEQLIKVDSYLIENILLRATESMLESAPAQQ